MSRRFKGSAKQQGIYSHFIVVPVKDFIISDRNCFFQFSVFQLPVFLSPCVVSATKFSPIFIEETGTGYYISREIGAKEENMEYELFPTYLLETRFRYSRAISNFIFRGKARRSSPTVPFYIVIFFHAGHVYTGNSRRRWLRSSRSRESGIDSEKTSRIRGTWKRVRIQKSSRICVTRSGSHDIARPE